MSKKDLVVNDIKDVWVAWTNTDLTEGRGEAIPLAVCELKSTAIRLGKGKSVQGINCKITKEQAVHIDGAWLSVFHLERPTKADLVLQGKIEAKETAIEKAIKAGLTKEDLAILQQATGG